MGGAIALCLIVAACGSDDQATEPSISATLLSAPPGSVGSSSTTGAGDDAPATTTRNTSGGPVTTSRTTGTVSTVVGAASTPAPESTGLPGGASDVAMCRDYATVVGSQSVLTIAGAFGDLDTAGVARLELIAAPAMTAAAEALTDEWPTELAAEQAAVERSVIAPIVDRADVAALAVEAAGVDEAQLLTAWQATLAAYDPSRPTVTVTGLPADLEAALATAASTYASTAIRYDLDPSVLRTAPTPETTAFLFENCPELSYLIAGDGD